MRAKDVVYWARCLIGAICGAVFGVLNLSEALGLAAAAIAIPVVYAITTIVGQRYAEAKKADFNVKTEGVFSFIILWLFFWTLLMNLLYPQF